MKDIISKAFIVQKAWTEDSGDTHIEGWISTPKLDKDKHITEPEAFLPVMDEYFSNYAPISYHHGMEVLPAGHLQKAAVVRDGKIIKSVLHPTDPTDFKHFDGTGTGVYVHGVINDPIPSQAVRKGNVGCFSFTGHASGEVLSDGTTRWTTLSDWMESTISPYPINTAATFRIAKAHGYSTQEQEKDTPMTPEEKAELIALITAAVKPADATPPATPVVKASLTTDDLTTAIAALKTDLATDVTAQIEAKLIAKAATDRGTGAGSKATIPENANKLDAVDSAIQKAQAITPEHTLNTSIDMRTGMYKPYTSEAFTDEEQEAVNQMTWRAMIADMSAE